MKKLLSLFICLCLAVPLATSLTGCKKDDSSKVMNLSLNPSVEFVLDSNDKVVSVNATNDEGNFIIANATFVGLSKEDATELFIEVSEENGFIVKGSSGENELKIEVSGESAEKIYNDVKAAANEYLATLDNVSVSITFDETTVEELKSLVKECMQELTSKEVDALTEEELVQKIEESRQETKNLYSQELKDLYYQERAVEILNAKLEKVKELASQGSQMVSSFVSTLTTTAQTMISKLQEFKNTFVQNYLDPNSQYQIKMQEFISAKKELLEQRLAGASEFILNAKELAVATAESALEIAKAGAQAAISALDLAINTAVTTINNTIDSIVNLIEVKASEITTAINNAKLEVKADFSTEYGAYITVNYWNGLKPETETA
ncbi:MAG: hypothetical protein IKL82_05035 [Clostridia bacterium]|nr:hypothetical protein [Clostridia bacterium]